MLVKLVTILTALLVIPLDHVAAVGQMPSTVIGCDSNSPPVQTAQLSWTKSEQDNSKFQIEGECLLKLTSKLTRLKEEVTLTLCNLGSPFAKPHNVAKLVEYVKSWQQDVKYTECRLEDFGQELVTRQPSVEKLVMLLSHALDSVAMANFLDDKLSEVFAEISYLDSKIDSNPRFEHILIDLKNFLTEVALAMSIIEETSVVLFARNFTFQRQVVVVAHLNTVSAAIANTQLMSSLSGSQNIEELVLQINYQALQLRKMADLLDSIIRNDSTSAAAVDHLQRVKNSVNRKEQQIVFLVQLISTVQDSLSVPSALLSSILETTGMTLFMLESGVTKFDSYRNALLIFQGMMSQVLEHTLSLLLQFESIQQIADRYSISEVDSPFSILDDINAAVQEVQEVIENIRPPVSLQMDVDILTRTNCILLENITGTYAMIQDLKLQTGAQLTQRIGCLTITLDSLLELKQNLFPEELKNKTKDLHQQVNELSISVMLLVKKTDSIRGTIRSIEEFTPPLINRIQVVSNVTVEAEEVLEVIPSHFPGIRERNLLVIEATNSINVSFNDTVAQFQSTRVSFETAEEIVNSILNLLDQVSLPVQFSNDSILTLNPESEGHDQMSGTMTTDNSEFYSISFTVRKTDLSDCIIIQLTEIWQQMDQYISVTVGVINGSLTANFVFSHPIGGMESVSLAIRENTVPPNKRFSVEVSRIDRNVHLFLQDIESERVFCMSSSISNMMSSFFRTTSVMRRTSISLGGASSSIQNMPFLGIGNFTGCLSEILLNGENLELWFLATSAQIGLQPCSSSDITLRELRISCDGSEYAQATILQGNLLPMVFSFSSFRPNGMLMYAFNKDMASSIQVSLIYGHVVVKIDSNGEQMTLTSLQTYTNGADQFFSVSLSSNQDTLVLKTSLEETIKRLEFTETEAALNHTNIFLCGVPDDLVNETGRISNFTGCAALSSRAVLHPIPLNCLSSVKDGQCSYCSNEVTYSVSFYGTSFASFPPITVKERFDFGFSFVTSFPSALLLHSGNSSRGLWFDVVMINGQLQLLFGSPFGILSLPARTLPLNDLVRHTVLFIVNMGSNIDILMDGSRVGSFPFGSFFPAGTLTPSLSVGGIDPVLEAIVLPGVTTEGFKGCIDSLHVLGQPVDFSKSKKAEQVNFKFRNESQTVDAFHFDGEGYARYDVGRFAPNFKFGFQLRTLSPSALLLYIEDAFALQVVDGEVGMIIASDETVGSIVAISNRSNFNNISDGFWHSVVVRKSGSHVQFLIDEHLTAETNTAPQLIRTDSDLFIGGVPSNRSVSLPGVISEEFNGEMRMAYLAHSVRSDSVQHTILETT